MLTTDEIKNQFVDFSPFKSRLNFFEIIFNEDSDLNEILICWIKQATRFQWIVAFDTKLCVSVFQQ